MDEEVKRLVVRLEYELEVPEEAEIQAPAADIGDMLFIDGHYLEPHLTWLRLTDISDDGTWTTESLEEDMEIITAEAIRMVSSEMEFVERDAE